MLATLAGDLTISDTTAKKLLADLPADLDPERRAVVETACRLVGKVNYFWGGKSLVIGWDSRWGELRQVTAAGSSTTGRGNALKRSPKLAVCREVRKRQIV